MPNPKDVFTFKFITIQQHPQQPRMFFKELEYYLISGSSVFFSEV